MKRFLSLTLNAIHIVFLRLPSFVFVLCLIFNLSSCAAKETVTKDFSTYLDGSSDFETGISTVMPLKEDLENAKILDYTYYYSNLGFPTYSKWRILFLAVEYSYEEFVNAKAEIEENCLDEDIEEISYNDILFNGYWFHEGCYCAVGYHICSDSNTILYLGFRTDELSYMNAQQSAKYLPDIDIKHP